MHRIDLLLLEAAADRLRHGCGNSAPAREQFVNLSGDLLRHPDMIMGVVETLAAMRKAHDGSSGLVLTLNECQISQRSAQVASILAPLLEAGCRLALGDYGADASSHRFLAKLPVSYVAIDPTLVRLASESPRARTVLAGINRTAHELGQKTIAKQVEDRATLERLLELGIDWGQGYLFGAPCGSAEMPASRDGPQASRPDRR